MRLIVVIYNSTRCQDIQVDRPFHVFFFFNFDMCKFRKIRQYHWKECSKINKIAQFESDLWKTNEDTASQSGEIFQTFVWWGAQTCPKQNKQICLSC